jgi:murein DD-endopeptidase MepM/ murein hydrolase activator NlpD
VASAAVLAAALSLGSPVDCRIGETCFIQQYADHDPGPGAKDYRCGSLTYDGHDGTDFRIPTLAAQRAGVKVLAAAAGVVKGVRDGMDDVPVDRIGGPAAVDGRECGNGVLLVHADGWETQYCHMARGSVRVKPGQAVAAGEPLGLVGESGDAAFPHLHLTVRHAGQWVDPFAYGAPAGACGGGAALWTAEAARAMAYREPQLINQGFAAGGVSMGQIEEGAIAAPGADPSALVAYVRLIGLKLGDRPALELDGPAGPLAAPAPAPLDHDKAQYMLFAGVRRPAAGWPKGRYQARVTVTRHGKPVLERRFEMGL